jgi:FMN-dependent NADH-azoreductase
MTKLLHIIGSPMEELSFSRRVGEAFVAAWSRENSDGEVETLDLWTTDLPDFDKTASAGKFKMSRGMEHSEEEAAAWVKVSAFAKNFAAADRFVISTGMWNFGLPYRLKQYFDVIVQPFITFDPKTYSGMVTDKPVQLVLASGGVYEDGAPNDFVLPYLKVILGFIGVTDVRALRLGGTAGPPEKTDAVLQDAIAKAEVAARGF